MEHILKARLRTVIQAQSAETGSENLEATKQIIGQTKSKYTELHSMFLDFEVCLKKEYRIIAGSLFLGHKLILDSTSF